MLCGKHRIEIDYEMGEWRRLLLREGLTEIPVDGEIAIRAGNLTDFQADPPTGLSSPPRWQATNW